jgi:hypothetical protein
MRQFTSDTVLLRRQLTTSEVERLTICYFAFSDDTSDIITYLTEEAVASTMRGFFASHVAENAPRLILGSLQAFEIIAGWITVNIVAAPEVEKEFGHCIHLRRPRMTCSVNVC